MIKLNFDNIFLDSDEAFHFWMSPWCECYFDFTNIWNTLGSKILYYDLINLDILMFVPCKMSPRQEKEKFVYF